MACGSRTCRESALDPAVFNQWSAIREVVGAANARGGIGRLASIQTYHSEANSKRGHKVNNWNPAVCRDRLGTAKNSIRDLKRCFPRSHVPHIYGNRSNAPGVTQGGMSPIARLSFLS